MNPPTSDEVWDIIRILKNNMSPVEDNVGTEFIKYREKKIVGRNSRTNRSNVGIRKNAREMAKCNYVTYT